MKLRKHPKHFVECSDAIIVSIDNVLFSISRRSLTQYAKVFEVMLSLPQGSSTMEGQTIDNPINLHNAPLHEFEALLDMISVAELGIEDHRVTLDHAWSTWLAAETRWETVGLMITLVNGILGENKIHALLLDFSHRFGRSHWTWPVIFHPCIRKKPLSALEVSILTNYAKDKATISAIRIVLENERHDQQSQFWIEMRVRELLRVIHPQLQEPDVYSSEIPAPQTGYRYYVPQHAPFEPPVDKPGMNHFKDANGSALFVGTAHVENDKIAIPAKIIGYWQGRSGIVSYAYRNQEHHGAHSYSIIFIDNHHMEWISTTDGQVPHGRTPVLGGYDASLGGDLYHAIAIAGQVYRNTPGHTAPSLRGARFPFSWRVHELKEDYLILVWKPRRPETITVE